MLLWNDIAKYTTGYTNGIKRLKNVLSDAKESQNKKLNHKTNTFNINPSVDDYGLDKRITIKTMKFKSDNDLKNMFNNKSTPSHSLKGQVELSPGTKRVIEMTNKMIPKVDHSKVEPKYQRKSNKDLILKNLSKSFARDYVEGLKEKELSNDSELIPLRDHSPPPLPRHKQPTHLPKPERPPESIPRPKRAAPLIPNTPSPHKPLPSPHPKPEKPDIPNELSPIPKLNRRNQKLDIGPVTFSTPQPSQQSTPQSSKTSSESPLTPLTPERIQAKVNNILSVIEHETKKNPDSINGELTAGSKMKYKVLAKGLDVDLSGISTRKDIFDLVSPLKK